LANKNTLRPSHQQFGPWLRVAVGSGAWRSTVTVEGHDPDVPISTQWPNHNPNHETPGNHEASPTQAKQDMEVTKTIITTEELGDELHVQALQREPDRIESVMREEKLQREIESIDATIGFGYTEREPPHTRQLKMGQHLQAAGRKE
jgi:hypothetical protein